jgi:D-arabinose 1-dehydrogenase-like Zn-dependent alcohol dehydrogenase
MTDSINSWAAISNGQGGFVIEPTQIRAPKGSEVRVRMAAAGICHTDQQSLSWDGPMVLGHEGAGWIESMGPDVKGLHIGQPVLLNWAIPCGHCHPCTSAQGHLCDRTQGLSKESPAVDTPHTFWQNQDLRRSFNLGTFSQYTLLRAEALTPLPPSLQFYAWYAHTLPLLLWATALPVPVKLALAATIEAVWCSFPPSPAGSGALLAAHVALLVGLAVAPVTVAVRVKGRRR